MLKYDKYNIKYINNNIENDLLISFLENMLKIRLFEEAVGNLITEGEIRTPCHLYMGQEAVAVGVCSALEKEDYIFSNHRNHGHYIAKGGNIREAMAEILCRSSGCSSGRGGSVHLIDKSVNFPGSSAIVGANIPLAVGAAQALLYKKRQNISVVFHGDGSVEEGVWSECLNYSSLHSLPVLFICENNQYASHLSLEERQNSRITDISSAYNIESVSIDGNNILEVYSVSNQYIKKMKLKPRPIFIECNTYRQREHCGASTQIGIGKRTYEEWEYWIDRCPIDNYISYLVMQNIAKKQQIMNLYEMVLAEIEDAVMFAKESKFPDAKSLKKYVYKV